jgi:hypothetical protein
MKIFPVGFVALLLSLSLGAPLVRGEVRTMANLPGIPVAGLRAILPHEAYQKLINEPIKAWIVVRGQVMKNRIWGARIARSEANGVYDKIAVQMANGMQLYSFDIGSRVAPTVLVHVFVYQLPKGEHAIALAQNDAVGDANLIYSRSIMLRYLGLANQQAPASKPKKK